MQNSFENDTITAVATSSGTGAIAVIRISGPEAIRSVDEIFEGKGKLLNAATHTIHYGKIVDSSDITIDDVLVSVFRSPNSYTGEDSVEISTHGSSFITKRIVEILAEKGVRIAEPGEFTKRAYLNNKLDLAQAEAVLDIINSRTEAAISPPRRVCPSLRRVGPAIPACRAGSICPSRGLCRRFP